MILLPENTSVKNIASLYEAIHRELQQNDDVLLDFSQVGRIDLSVAQLIIAAGRRARDAGKTLRLRSVSETIRRQMELCGIKT
jgi:anti-anti-sigma regulatory factor